MKKYVLLLMTILTGFTLAGCTSATSGTDDKTITLVMNEIPEFKEIATVVEEEVEKQGYKLKPIYLTDIIQPNKVVDSKEYDANFFQHQAYLNQFNQDQGTNVVAAFELFNVPSGLYSKRYESIEEVPDRAIVAIPIDPANNGRALFMLQDQGLLKLTEGVKVIHASVKDIIENPKGLKFKEVEQQMLARTISDVDLGFLFTSAAEDAGITADDAVVIEKQDENLAFYNLIVGVHPDNLNSEKTKVLQKAFQNDRVKEVIESSYSLANVLW